VDAGALEIAVSKIINTIMPGEHDETGLAL
jgi:hypothetical protein